MPNFLKQIIAGFICMIRVCSKCFELYLFNSNLLMPRSGILLILYKLHVLILHQHRFNILYSQLTETASPPPEPPQPQPPPLECLVKCVNYMFHDNKLQHNTSKKCFTDKTKKLVTDLEKMISDYDEFANTTSHHPSGLNSAMQYSLNLTKRELCIDFTLNGANSSEQFRAVTERLFYKNVYEAKGRIEILNVAIETKIWYLKPPHYLTEVQYAEKLRPLLNRAIGRSSVEDEMVRVKFTNDVKEYKTDMVPIKANQIWTILHSKSVNFFEERLKFMVSTFMVFAINSVAFVSTSERLYCMELLNTVNTLFHKQRDEFQATIEQIFSKRTEPLPNELSPLSCFPLSSFFVSKVTLSDYSEGVKKQYADEVPWAQYGDCIYLEIRKVRNSDMSEVLRIFD